MNPSFPSFSTVLPLPPPAPPAPPAPSANIPSTSIVNLGLLLHRDENESVKFNSSEEFVKLLLSVVSLLNSELSIPKDLTYDLYFNGLLLDVRVQSSKSCGLQAVKMCCDSILKSHVLLSERHDKLLSNAQNLGMSKEGEMYSVLDLERLVSLTYGTGQSLSLFSVLKAVDEGEFQSKLISLLLMSNRLAVLPYDADANSSPGEFGGIHAHYCVIVGLICLVPSSSCSSLPLSSQSLVDLDESSQVNFLRSPTSGTIPTNISFSNEFGFAHSIHPSKMRKDDARSMETTKSAILSSSLPIFAICQHSRSIHPFVSPLSRLVKSNFQLFQDVAKMEKDRWVIPEDFCELRGHALMIETPFY